MVKMSVLVIKYKKEPDTLDYDLDAIKHTTNDICNNLKDQYEIEASKFIDCYGIGNIDLICEDDIFCNVFETIKNCNPSFIHVDWKRDYFERA